MAGGVILAKTSLKDGVPLPRLLPVLGLALVAPFMPLVAFCSPAVPLPRTPTPVVTASPMLPDIPAATAERSYREAGRSTAPSLPPSDLPALLEGIEVERLQTGSAPLSDGVVLLVCGTCQRPSNGVPQSLSRITPGRPDGAELLARSPYPARAPQPLAPPMSDWLAGLGGAQKPYCGLFGEVVASPDGQEIVASYTQRTPCPYEPQAGSQLSAAKALLRSADGGVTWSPFGKIGGQQRLDSVLSPGTVLISEIDPQSVVRPGPYTRLYAIYPSGDVLDPPNGRGDLQPVPLSDGRILWLDSSAAALLNQDGTVFLDAQQGNRWVRLEASPSLPMTVEQGSGRRIMAAIDVTGPGAHRYFLLQLAPDGKPLRAYETFHFVRPVTWLGADRLIGTEASSTLPPGNTAVVVVDLNGKTIGTASSIGWAGAGGQVIGVAQGTFARVVVGDSCLAVRAKPAVSAPTQECLADGVLVRLAGSPGAAQHLLSSSEWVDVITPSGLYGFAHTQYLQR